MDEKTLLLELIEGFSSREITQMKKLIDAEYWNLKQEDKAFLLKLFRVSVKNRTKYCRQEERKDGQNFKYKNVRLTKFIKDYILLLTHKKENSIQEQLQLAEFYNNRGLDKIYKRTTTMLQKQLEEAPQDLDTSLYQFHLYEMQATRSRNRHEPMPELPKMIWALNQFYKEQKHRIFCEFQSQKQGINVSYTEDTTTGIVQELLYHLEALISKPNQEKKSYLYLKKHIFEEAHKSGINIQKMIYIHLINYTIEKINVGCYFYAQECSALIQLMMEKKIYVENKRLDYARFRNTILIYLIEKPKDTDRIRTFIETYFPYLDALYPDTISSIYHIYLLMVDRQLDEAEEALAFLNRNQWSTIEDLFHKIQVKKLQLQIMYLQYLNKKSHPVIYEVKIVQDKTQIDAALKRFNAFTIRQDKLKNNGLLELCRTFAKLLRRQTFYGDVTKEQVETTKLALSDKVWFHSTLS